MLNELIPNIGDRLNFIEKYEEYVSQKKNDVSSYVNILQYLLNYCVFIYTYIFYFNQDICILQVESNEMLPSVIPVVQDTDLISSKVMNTSDNNFTVLIPVDKSRQISHSSQELFVGNEMPDFNLTQILEQAPMGRTIISYYASKQCLNDCLRNKLVDIIMTHLFSFHAKQ